MREPIGRLVSSLFYAGELSHHATHSRLALSWPFDREIVWVDTGAQAEYRDMRLSVANQFEVALCKDIVGILKKEAADAKLAVISMYASQVERLVASLKGILERGAIESVDAFEGQEADGVILSLVRSNPRAQVGFLNNRPRVNVAISRAKRLLVIVADASTVVAGAPTLFGPILEAARRTDRVIGVGAVILACGRLGIRSQTAAFARQASKTRKVRQT